MLCVVKLFNLLFFVSFATGYFRSGEIKIKEMYRPTVITEVRRNV